MTSWGFPFALVGEYDVEKAPQLRGQLAFSGSVAPAVLPEVDDLSVFTFGADHREEEKLLSLEKSSKGSPYT